MNNSQLIIDENLKVIFSINQKYIGLGIQEIFIKDRSLSTLIRWILSADNNRYKGKVTFLDQEDRLEVEAIRQEKSVLLVIGSAEETNDLTQNFWHVFSQTFPGGLLFINSKLKIIEISHSLLSILEVKNKDGISLSKKSIIGEKLTSLFHQNETEELVLLIQTYIQDVNYNRETLSFDTKYREKHLNIRLGPVFDKKICVGYCIYIFDISQEIEKNLQIEHQESMLLNSSKLASLGEMAGGIAHEINNPLTIISFATQGILRKLKNNQLDNTFLEKKLMNITSTIERMSKIVKGMRNISRETGEQDEYDLCTIDELLNDIIPLCQQKFKTNNILLMIEIPKNLRAMVINIFRVQFSQVILNLLTNAFDELMEKDISQKWVNIKINILDDILTFRISDAGSGIPQEIQEKIFQPFFTTKEIGKGTGLGLSLSHSIITQKHNGSFYIDSNSSNTCFVIEVPIKKNIAA
ncbi:HAMP domain-containing histidine kinase [Bacteriovoracaceae bacterium]|nr:HAMP domain-containing histidine kinase [Bacteriovoracaceae bacterium]